MVILPKILAILYTGMVSGIRNYENLMVKMILFIVHVYNYYGNAWNPDTYPNLRFSSEYGLQSMPCYQTLLEATDNPTEDLERNSAFMNHRQHSILNFVAIDLQILMHFPTIKRISLKDYVFQSQVGFNLIHQLIVSPFY